MTHLILIHHDQEIKCNVSTTDRGSCPDETGVRSAKRLRVRQSLVLVVSIATRVPGRSPVKVRVVLRELTRHIDELGS